MGMPKHIWIEKSFGLLKVIDWGVIQEKDFEAELTLLGKEGCDP